MAGELLTDEEMGLAPRPAPTGPADGLLLSDADLGLTMEKPSGAPVTLEDRAARTYGPDELLDRATFLPVGVTQKGDVTLAVPGIVQQLAKSALLPGHVMQGGSYTPQEALGFTLDFAVPGVSGRAPGAQTARTSRSALIANAPGTDELQAASTAAINRATGSGTVAPAAQQDALIGGLLRRAQDEARLRPSRHPQSIEVLKDFRPYIGKDMDVQDIIGHRQMLQDAATAAGPGTPDQRVVVKMLDEFDDFIDTQFSGNLGDELKEFRTLWARSKRSQDIEGIIQRASRQPSGFENGVRIGVRRILNNPKLRRGWSKEELRLMEDIAKGKGTNIPKLLGKFGFRPGANGMLGGTIGTGAGAAAGGPLGALAVPAAGQISANAADDIALRNLDVLRAATASGVAPPRNNYAVRALMETLNKGAGPAVSTQLPQQPQPRGQTITLPNGVQVRLDPNVL